MGGKIIDSNEVLTNQVDIVIYDNALPHFGANDKTYFFAEGSTYALEVKSNLRSTELRKAVENLSTVKKCKKQFGGSIVMGDLSPDIATGVFAYDTKYSSSQAVLQALKNLEKDFPPIDFLCINKKMYIGYNRGGWVSRKADGTEEKLPVGYLIIDNGEGCIWRMVITIAQEAKKVVTATVDFHKYFLSAYK